MALVCDIKSDPSNEQQPTVEEPTEDLEDGEIEDDDEEAPPAEQTAAITPDDPKVAQNGPPKQPNDEHKLADKPERDRSKERSERSERRNRHEEKRKHLTEAEKSVLRLRRREKLQREKWEKYRKEQMVQEKEVVDDFASNLEKALACILKKDKPPTTDDEKEEDKRTRKRKKHDHENRIRNKERRTESPRQEEIDENEMLNVRGGIVPMKPDEIKERSVSGGNSEDSSSEASTEQNVNDDKKKNKKRENKKGKGKNRRDRNRQRDKREKPEQLKDAQGICVFYLQGKCQKNDCPYSHEAVPPMKLELCKFYLMDCCAKGDKCSYMHSEFPCKFYHTGIPCLEGDNCRFAHGKPLNDRLKQILFKHIETAPRDILGGFPRMSREEALNLINVTQKSLLDKFGEMRKDPMEIPSLFDINVPVPPELLDASNLTEIKPKAEKTRSRPSRWQDPEPYEKAKLQEHANLNFGVKPFSYGQDQDMRINSNGDVDMRALPIHSIPPVTQCNLALPALNPTKMDTTPAPKAEIDVEQYKREAGLIPDTKDVDIRSTTMLPFNQDVDIRQTSTDPRILASKDVDIRQLPPAAFPESEDQPMLQVDAGVHDPAAGAKIQIPPNLPKTQQELYLRIQAHQKDNVLDTRPDEGDNDMSNIDWYSDDDDDDENRLMIKVDGDDFKEKEEEGAKETESSNTPLSTNSLNITKPSEVVEKLGDLSKIDISAEVTKLLTSISQSTNPLAKDPKPVVNRDPRQANVDPRPTAIDPRLTPHDSTQTPPDPRLSGSNGRLTSDPRQPADPRLSADPRKAARKPSIEGSPRSDKVSIYELGSIDIDDIDLRVNDDFRGTRSDVDLRDLQLPFKGMQNYTPATEIDGSIASHPPIQWKVNIVDIPRPDYTGLKLNVNDAEKTGDPRLRKIFRLSVDERETPASPKASPKSSTSIRIDPRLKKAEENKPEVASMTYAQQVAMLQSSAFYQSLTSNQKLLLNQELLAQRPPDQSGSNDPLLNSVLTNLNLIPGSNVQNNPNLGAALNILTSVNKLNPMLGGPPNPIISQNPAIVHQNTNILSQMAQSIVQPGLLGAAPGIPNLPPDFPINFDPRNNGLLGNGPPGPFNNFPPDAGGFGNFNDDFYPDNQNFNRGNRERNFNNRDRRRGRNFNRNSGNRNFRNRNNRTNRTHSPP